MTVEEAINIIERTESLHHSARRKTSYSVEYERANIKKHSWNDGCIRPTSMIWNVRDEGLTEDKREEAIKFLIDYGNSIICWRSQYKLISKKLTDLHKEKEDVEKRLNIAIKNNKKLLGERHGYGPYKIWAHLIENAELRNALPENKTEEIKTAEALKKVLKDKMAAIGYSDKDLEYLTVHPVVAQFSDIKTRTNLTDFDRSVQDKVKDIAGPAMRGERFIESPSSLNLLKKLIALCDEDQKTFDAIKESVKCYNEILMEFPCNRYFPPDCVRPDRLRAIKGKLRAATSERSFSIANLPEYYYIMTKYNAISDIMITPPTGPIRQEKCQLEKHLSIQMKGASNDA